MNNSSPKINSLRQHALMVKDNLIGIPPQDDLSAERAWWNSSNEPWVIIRHARESSAILTDLIPIIDEGELIVGKYAYSNLSPEEEKDLNFYKEKIIPAKPLILGMKSHMAIDFDKLLRLGINGIQRQITQYCNKLDLTKPDALIKDAFYRACQITLQGLLNFAKHYAEMAESLAASVSDPNRKQELLVIANNLRRVPEFPAESFYEAVQSVHLVTFCLGAGTRTALFQYGRPDRYLLPYYNHDLKKGIITKEKAQELIDCLGILLTEYTSGSLAVGWMVGGRNAAGEDISNELTMMFLESIRHIHLSYPCVGLCWTEQTPAEIMKLSGELLAEGLSNPALFNDDVITSGLSDIGLPPAEACLYQNSTCVEITPIASSNVYVASPYINLLQLLHDVLGIKPLDQVNGNLEDSLSSNKRGPKLPQTFDELIESYKKILVATVTEAVIDQNTQQATRYYHGGQPLLSCFVNDCLIQGKDIDQGGARYNWIEPSFVGLANLVDSLQAIKKVVYEDQQLTLVDLLQFLREDFRGNETIRQLLINRIPKYGTDNDSTDTMAIQITNWIQEIVKQFKSYYGGDVISGFFTWIMHEQLGKNTAASADGRRAGFPLSAGAGASQGCEEKGPTAAVLSSTKWHHSPHLGGIAVNLKFNKPRDDELFEQRLSDVVKTYLNRGGFEIQVNVVDKKTLEAAQKNPEQYRDLVVRIGGYSDYFVRLSPAMQAEIIQRSQHNL